MNGAYCIVYCLVVRRQEILNILYCNNNYTNKLLLPFTKNDEVKIARGRFLSSAEITIHVTRFFRLIHTWDHSDQRHNEAFSIGEVPIVHHP